MITAVDVGATKTLVAQFTDSGTPCKEARFLTPQDPEAFLAELHKHLKNLSDITALAIGVPGRAPDGVVTSCANLPLWKHVPLVQSLEEAYKCPVFIENDANLAALSEINALSPTPKVGLYLTISTGIGSGFVVGGRLASLLSRHTFGRMTLYHEDRWQEWEDFASGKAIAKQLGRKAQDITSPAEWRWVAEQLAAGLCAIIHPLRPDVIVFGGGVGAYLGHFKKPLEDILDQRLNPTIRPTLLLAKHPNEAVLYGCYYYATHQLTA